jgi:hypothetical protein
MISHKHIKKGDNEQQKYLIAERKQREKLTKMYVDQPYEWQEGFD